MTTLNPAQLADAVIGEIADLQQPDGHLEHLFHKF